MSLILCINGNEEVRSIESIGGIGNVGRATEVVEVFAIGLRSDCKLLLVGVTSF